MTPYSFTTSFTIQAPIKDVWDVLLHFPEWKSWWPGVRHMKVGKETNPPTLHVGIGFPIYTLDLHLQITKIDIGHEIRFITSGDLVGDGKFILHAVDQGTTVDFDWNVATPKLWMNIVARIAKPIFEFSHNHVMHWFVNGLAKKLDAKIIHANYKINNTPKEIAKS